MSQPTMSGYFTPSTAGTSALSTQPHTLMTASPAGTMPPPYEGPPQGTPPRNYLTGTVKFKWGVNITISYMVD